MQHNKLNVYVVYDKVAEEAGPPYTAANDAVASRACAALLVQSEVLFPDDYDLRCIATYDPAKGLITVLERPVVVPFLADYNRALDQLSIKEVSA